MKAAVPDVEVIDAGADPPPSDLRADVLFGGWGPHSLEYAQRVDWVHLAGTGIDSYPAEMFDGRIVTNAPGASAIPIAEFVLAAMLAFEKRLPETWIHEPPEHWNFAPLGWLNTRTLGLVGLGGIGLATAERALPFGMKVRALRRRPEPSPLEGVEVVGSIDELLAGGRPPGPRGAGDAAHPPPHRRGDPRAGQAGCTSRQYRPGRTRRPGCAPRCPRRRSRRDGHARHGRPRTAAGRPLALLTPEGAAQRARVVGVTPRAWRAPSRSSSTTSAATPPASRCCTSSTPTRGTRDQRVP